MASRLSNRNCINPKLIIMLQKSLVVTADLGDEFGYSALLKLFLTLPERCQLKYRRSERIPDSWTDFDPDVHYSGSAEKPLMHFRCDGLHRMVNEKCGGCFRQIFLESAIPVLRMIVTV